MAVPLVAAVELVPVTLLIMPSLVASVESTGSFVEPSKATGPFSLKRFTFLISY